MPHLRLEYTDNISQQIDFSLVFDRLHRVLNRFGDIDLKNCKSRSVKLTDHYYASGEDISFVHLEVRIFAGRSREIKSKICNKLLQVLVNEFSEKAANNKLQITVEMNDIDQSAYGKFIS